ncbi:MAG: histidine phosphatase family protein [Actinobacteria bacterium]|nr:histidine phosphatase family protein [Actinomycetota bacterium]
MVDIYLCRHGRTPLNVAGRLRGRLDPELDLVGVAEARDLARHLGGLGITRVIASPLKRAVQTATPIAESAGVRLETDARLLDRDYGEFDGTSQEEVIARYGSLEAAPGVEPAEAVIERARSALEALVSEPGPIVVVSHDAVLRLVLDALAPIPIDGGHLPPRTGSWSLLRNDAVGWQLVVVNRKDDPFETALAR